MKNAQGREGKEFDDRTEGEKRREMLTTGEQQERRKEKTWERTQVTENAGHKSEDRVKRRGNNE